MLLLKIDSEHHDTLPAGGPKCSRIANGSVVSKQIVRFICFIPPIATGTEEIYW